MYVIKAASFILPIPFFKKIVHNFWILEDTETNKVVAQLHGLATSRSTGNIIPIGYNKDHSLRAHHLVLSPEFAKKYGFEVSKFRLPHNIFQLVYAGEDALQRWFNAVNAITTINKLDLDYPRGGFNLPFAKTINSNTIYHTFADIMDIEFYLFPKCIQIGCEGSLFTNIQETLSKGNDEVKNTYFKK